VASDCDYGPAAQLFFDRFEDAHVVEGTQQIELGLHLRADVDFVGAHRLGTSGGARVPRSRGWHLA
jgi:hypothetical protein